MGVLSGAGRSIEAAVVCEAESDAGAVMGAVTTVTVLFTLAGLPIECRAS